jgi:hypothetical protein
MTGTTPMAGQGKAANPLSALSPADIAAAIERGVKSAFLDYLQGHEVTVEVERPSANASTRKPTRTPKS